MMKFIKATALIISLFIFSATIIGCVIRNSPIEEFQSFEELKNSLNGDSRIIFPDLTGYEYDKDHRLYWKVYQGKNNIIMGYDIGDGLDTTKSESNLWSLNISCRLLDTAYNKSNPEPSLNANMSVSGIDVHENIVDTPNDPHTNLYPEGSRSVFCSYAFDFNDCRYVVGGTLIILPEKLKSLDDQGIDALIESSKKELQKLIKSIVEKE